MLRSWCIIPMAYRLQTQATWMSLSAAEFAWEIIQIHLARWDHAVSQLYLAGRTEYMDDNITYVRGCKLRCLLGCLIAHEKRRMGHLQGARLIILLCGCRVCRTDKRTDRSKSFSGLRWRCIGIHWISRGMPAIGGFRWQSELEGGKRDHADKTGKIKRQTQEKGNSF
ncbi:uncharacterized protein BO80DRAFT_292247 [Aspergillus ibericus CBS 121593]|uniref:Uncharacterized protein n=1 Tax=Aspergillus ibericus CBS 121593 TaxID=1448316 RepID=A0A395GJG1_9EURO|nr:hypothetical protein BO80DRAFT_292247 [Aspergillus ibericus CBS 121593]RAK94897.1 hypothetical protein BO80DRAFT_292247 [Aspergillus ibericus CBS 121593]